MAEIFVSHAVADEALADKFVAFLKEAIGVPASAIFCSSLGGHSIPLGYDFNDYLKEKIKTPKIVILLLTPRYMESRFCLMELGATWALSLHAIPIVVPPIEYDAVSSTLGLKQGWNITEHEKLNALRDEITGAEISLESRTPQDWDKKRASWKADLSRLLKKLPGPTAVTLEEYNITQDSLKKTEQELSNLQEEFREANDLIDELKAAKDPSDVRSILSNREQFDVDQQFYVLIDEVNSARPKGCSTQFYRNMIMDLYGRSLPADWSYQSQKEDMELAISYKLVEPEHPYSFLWDTTKLKRVSSAVSAVQSFLEFNADSDFIKEKERNSISMECDDLAFWEEFLN